MIKHDIDYLQYALDYAAQGWAVFPCTGKMPKTKHGFKDATKEPEQVKKWWTKWPSANIGIATGAVSGFVVIDIDRKHGGLETLDQLVKRGEPLENFWGKTLWAKTGGGGFHIIYKHPGLGWRVGNKTGILQGVDIRGDGGYIIAPPSIHPDTKAQYEWGGEPDKDKIGPLPAAFFEQIAKEEGAEPTIIMDGEWEPLNIGETIPEGRRNEMLYKMACSLRAKNVNGPDMLAILRETNATKCRPPLPMREVEIIAKSAQKHPPGSSWTKNGRGTVAGGNGKPKQKRTPKQADILVALGQKYAKFFREYDDKESVFATFNVGTHTETSQIRNNRFKKWLKRKFFEIERKTPGTQAVQDAVGMLEAMADDSAVKKLNYRVAGHEGKIYVDLTNEKWDVVEIQAGSWQILPGHQSPCYFLRSGSTHPLPYPIQGGDMRELRQFLNLKDEKSWVLTAAWILGAFLPEGPFPILVLKGEQGAGKSTFTTFLKNLIDPSKGLKRVAPKEGRDFFIAATHSWVMAYDNLSGIPAWLSDLFCVVSTGGGFSCRALYKDNEETIFDVKRPLILNGIGAITTRQDLIDRSIFVELGHIDDKDKVDEGELKKSFAEALPSILGGVFHAIAIGLANLDTAKPDLLPRMADFARWAYACEPGYSDEGLFLEYYRDNQEDAVFDSLEGDPVVEGIELLVQQGIFEGTPSALYKSLIGLIPEGNRLGKDWPKNPRALGWKLARLTPALRKAGIGIERVRIKKGRGYKIWSL